MDCWGCGRITSVEGNSTLGVEEREHVIWRDMSIKKRHFLPAGICAHNALSNLQNMRVLLHGCTCRKDWASQTFTQT